MAIKKIKLPGMAQPVDIGTTWANISGKPNLMTSSEITAAINSAFATNDAMLFKGTIGSSADQAMYEYLPVDHEVGWTYKVVTAGYYDDLKCEIGDLIICIKSSNEEASGNNDGSIISDDEAFGGPSGHWTVVQTNIDGAVVGPANSTINHIATFTGTTGKVIKDSGFTIEKSVPADAQFTDTTYENKAAVNEGTDDSLVSTGDKYNWNNKYTKPENGIPDTDFTDEVKENLNMSKQVYNESTINFTNIATFNAASADMPLKGLAVNIEPVQDLHGYDHPWPGGGGKNLLKYPYVNTTKTLNGVTFTDNGDGSITINGTATSTAYFSLIANAYPMPLPNGNYELSSTYIGVIPNNGFYIQAKANNDAEEAYINIGIGEKKIYTITNSEFFSACIIVSANSKINNVTVYPMLCLATETATAYEPYSNICPISGWTGCNVTIASEFYYRLTNSTMTDNGVTITNSDDNYALMTGTSITNSGIALVTFLANNTRLVISDVVADEKQQWFLWDATLKRNISGMKNDLNGQYTLTIGHSYSVGYLPISGRTYSLKTRVSLTHRQPTIYPITFPSEVGTVYGGTLDVVNERLTVDSILVTFDGSNSNGLEWEKKDSNLASIKFDTAISPYLPMMAESPILSNYLIKVAPYSDIPWTIEPGTGSEASEKRMWFKIPLNVLSSEDLITTFLGENNIWANTGDIAVTYGAYLETVKKHAEVVGDSILSAIAPLEASYTATRDYAVGSYLFVRTQFYRAIATIQTGEIITVGTNVEQTTIAELLATLFFKITKQPVNVKGNVGDNVSFTVEAIGVSAYQWQYSKNNGGSWKNCGEATANEATLELLNITTSTIEDCSFQCVLTGMNGGTLCTDLVRIEYT